MHGHYAPNVFVSVLAVRGREANAPTTALVDLGTPTYKLVFASSTSLPSNGAAAGVRLRQMMSRPAGVFIKRADDRGNSAFAQ